MRKGGGGGACEWKERDMDTMGREGLAESDGGGDKRGESDLK